MMKVSDPIIFGAAVSIFEEVLSAHADILTRIEVDFRNGLGDLYDKLGLLDDAGNQLSSRRLKKSIQIDLTWRWLIRPRHNKPSCPPTFTCASVAAMIREGGKMWNKEGKTQNTTAVIPDRSYSGVYQATIDFFKEHGAFNPSTMGSVSNVGLMAQKAEEYGSHDKTFQMEGEGCVQVVVDGMLLWNKRGVGRYLSHVSSKDAPIQNWVKLADRARATGSPAVSDLDANCP